MAQAMTISENLRELNPILGIRFSSIAAHKRTSIGRITVHSLESDAAMAGIEGVVANLSVVAISLTNNRQRRQSSPKLGTGFGRSAVRRVANRAATGGTARSGSAFLPAELGSVSVERGSVNAVKTGMTDRHGAIASFFVPGPTCMQINSAGAIRGSKTWLDKRAGFVRNCPYFLNVLAWFWEGFTYSRFAWRSRWSALAPA